MLRILIFLTLLTNTSFGADKPFVRVRWKESELRIIYKNKLMTYDYGDSGDPDNAFLFSIDSVKTDYLAEKNSLIYMVLDVRGPSRGLEGAGSQCGAGTEAAKILFTFDANGEVKPPSRMLYESCFYNLYPTETSSMGAQQTEHGTAIGTFDTYPPAPEGHVLTKTTIIWLDPENPGQGFSRTERCTYRDTADQSSKAQSIPCP